jgi:hypothetical protein
MHINLFSQKKKERYDKTQEENVNQNDASTKNSRNKMQKIKNTVI